VGRWRTGGATRGAGTAGEGRRGLLRCVPQPRSARDSENVVAAKTRQSTTPAPANADPRPSTTALINSSYLLSMVSPKSVSPKYPSRSAYNEPASVAISNLRGCAFALCRQPFAVSKSNPAPLSRRRILSSAIPSESIR
jgi:hypothetical protein